MDTKTEKYKTARKNVRRLLDECLSKYQLPVQVGDG